MFREKGKEVAEYLERLGIDVLHFTTIVFILIVLSHYKDINNWGKLKWDQKFWIGTVIYGLITLATISLLRILGILELDY